MSRFLMSRLVRAAVTVFGVLTIVFFIVRLNGSPAKLMLGIEGTPEAVAKLNKAYGFDQSLAVQYGRFIRHALSGSLGESTYYARPALRVIFQRLPSTLQLAGASFLFGLIAASVLYFIAELSNGQVFRSGLLWFGAVVQAVPTFLLGVLFILLFSIRFKLLPALGDVGWKSMIMPTATLGLYQVALYVRLYSVAFAEQEHQDYVRTAYAKGQTRRAVVLRHMLPNAILPIVTVAGINLGQLIGGTVIVETVFNWPGIGHLIYEGVSRRDYPMVQAGVIVVAALFILINIVVDLISALLDPRVRLS